MEEADKEELIDIETIVIALDNKIHRIQELLNREHIRLDGLKERCDKCGG